MRYSQLIYFRIALVFLVCAFLCFIIKLLRIPGDEIIVRDGDTTLHDVIYFNTENFVNLFGLIVTYNLCSFAQSCYPHSQIVKIIRNIIVVLTIICFSRAMGHLFTYDQISTYELASDIVLITLFYIRKLVKKHEPDSRLINYHN